MLIYVTLAINVVAIAIWSIKNRSNGFAEVGKLLRGEPAFQSRAIPPNVAGQGGSFTPGPTEDGKPIPNPDSVGGGGGGAW